MVILNNIIILIKNVFLEFICLFSLLNIHMCLLMCFCVYVRVLYNLILYMYVIFKFKKCNLFFIATFCWNYFKQSFIYQSIILHFLIIIFLYGFLKIINIATYSKIVTLVCQYSDTLTLLQIFGTDFYYFIVVLLLIDKLRS